MHTLEQENLKRRPINLTIRADLLKEAKDLKLNASKAAELGIANAIKVAREETWLTENKKALQAHNQRIDNEGTLLTPEWIDQ